MARGRRAQSPEVKALKGNPGKRRLALENASKGATRPKRFSVDPPEYLTQDGERDAFNMVLGTLPANIVRASDVHAIARWATWLYVWTSCKLKLDGKAHWYESESKHGKFLREHPIAKRMNQAEAHLVTLEDRLGLNIVARNSIVHRLFQMPGAHPGGMFVDDPRADETPGTDPPTDAPGPMEMPQSPLGFLQQASKLN